MKQNTSHEKLPRTLLPQTLAKKIKNEDPEGITPPPASTFLSMNEFKDFSLEQVKVARDFIIRSKGHATSGAEDCEIDSTTGMCLEQAEVAVPSFSSCNQWSEAKGRGFVDDAKAAGKDAIWVAKNHLTKTPLNEIQDHWESEEVPLPAM